MPRSAGINHIALTVRDLDVSQHHLNFAGPDGIALELQPPDALDRAVLDENA